MKQRVKNISYLAKSVIELNTLKAGEAVDLFALPKGAEVIHFDVEVTQAGDSGAHIDIGLESVQDFFANDVDVSQKGYYKIARGTSINTISKATLTLNSASNAGEISVRVMYFLPTEYIYEI